MANNDAEDPLLSAYVDSPNQFKGKSALTRRKLWRTSTAPTQQSYLPEQHTAELLQQVEYTLAKKFDYKPVCVILAAYLGIGAICFFFFRNQIQGKKTNGVLDAIYLCVVTMTTAGYGDLVPDSKLAKVLACLFVFTGMALVGFLLSNAADYILEKQEILFVKAIHKKKKVDSTDSLKEVETNKVKYKVLTALALILVLILIGMIFLYHFEDMDLFDAFYCVCSSVTTLGFGDKSFSTKEGRLFSAFWILISTICWAQFFYYLAELYTERRQRSFIRWVLTRKLTAADLDDDRVVSAAEFIQFKLKEMGKISEEDVSIVMEGFRALDVDHSGTLTVDDLVFSQSTASQRK